MPTTNPDLPTDAQPSNAVTSDPTSSDATTTTTPTPAFVTADVFETKLAELQRAIQSQADKRDNRLTKAIQERTAQTENLIRDLLASGQIDNAQAGKIREHTRQKALNEVLFEPETQGQEQSQPNTQTAESPEIKQINQRGAELWEAYGLDNADPEAALIVTDKDAAAYLQSIKAAGIAKRQRLQQGQRAPVRNPEITAQGGNAGHFITETDTDSLYEKGARNQWNQINSRGR